MPKMTIKYSQAIQCVIKQVRLNPTEIYRYNQEQLYTTLQQAGYFWDSNAQRWDYHEPAAADAPTPLVMVRVWANAEIVEESADEIERKVKGVWQLVERSTAYQCRPPKQFEARVYLKFLPQPKAKKSKEVTTGQLVPCSECGQLYHNTNRWRPGRGLCPDCKREAGQ